MWRDSHGSLITAAARPLAVGGLICCHDRGALRDDAPALTVERAYSGSLLRLEKLRRPEQPAVKQKR